MQIQDFPRLALNPWHLLTAVAGGLRWLSRCGTPSLLCEEKTKAKEVSFEPVNVATSGGGTWSVPNKCANDTPS